MPLRFESSKEFDGYDRNIAGTCCQFQKFYGSVIEVPPTSIESLFFFRGDALPDLIYFYVTSKRKRNDQKSIF